MRSLTAFVAGTMALTGCARTPDVTHYYYPTTSQTTITITQAIDCNAAQTTLFTTEAPQVTTAYSADHDQTHYNLTIPFSIRTKDLDGFFSDSDFKLGRTEDGRLSSIDQSTTGQLAGVIKNVVSLVESAAAIGAGNRGPARAECRTVAKVGGGKPVTLTYSKTANLSQPVGNDTIFFGKDDVTDPDLYTALETQLPVLSIQLTQSVSNTADTSRIPSFSLTLG